MAFKLEMFRGDDREIEITATDAAGNPYDLAGSTVWFTGLSPFGTIAKKTGAGITTAGNVATVSIASADTNALPSVTTYLCDCQIKNVDGKVWTIATGTLMVKTDITRETI